LRRKSRNKNKKKTTDRSERQIEKADKQRKTQIVYWTERKNDWKHKKLFLNDRDWKIKKGDIETERQITTSKQKTEDGRKIKCRQHVCRKKKKEVLKDELINRQKDRQTTKSHFWSKRNRKRFRQTDSHNKNTKTDLDIENETIEDNPKV
jgi:hypothetical protein